MPGFTLQAAAPAQDFSQVRVDHGPAMTAEPASRLAGGQARQAGQEITDVEAASQRAWTAG